MASQDLKDRVVAVTGAAGNLGAACARIFAEQGARCALIDRGADRLAAAFAGWEGRHALLAGIDLLDAAAVEGAAKATLAKLGRIDALVHTAGGFAWGPKVHESTADDWSRMMAINLTTTVNAVRAFVPAMAAQKSGRVVAIGARPALGAGAMFGPYAASKAAVLRLIEALAAELRDSGVTANAVLPSTIDTPQNRKDMPQADFSKWVPPEQIARTIAFLISDAGRDVSGAAIPVYGRA